MTWKESLNHKIIFINVDFEVKERLFDLVKNKKTPTDIIARIKDMHWGEDKVEINGFVKEMKRCMKTGY